MKFNSSIFDKNIDYNAYHKILMNFIHKQLKINFFIVTF